MFSTTKILASLLTLVFLTHGATAAAQQTPADSSQVDSTVTADSLAKTAQQTATLDSSQTSTVELSEWLLPVLMAAFTFASALFAFFNWRHNVRLRRDNAVLARERRQAELAVEAEQRKRNELEQRQKLLEEQVAVLRAKDRAQEQIAEVKRDRKAKTDEARYRSLLEEEVCKIRLAGPGIGNITIDLDDTTFVYLNISPTHRAESEQPLGDPERMKGREDDLSPADVVKQTLAGDEHRILFIVGDPGAGKTTLMGYYARCCLDSGEYRRLGFSQQVIPFYLPLRDLDIDKELAWNLKNWADKQRSDFKKTIFRDWLDDHQTLVLLDGLDEITDDGKRRDACRWIGTAAASFPQTRFIITSRSTGYEPDENIFLQAKHFRADIRDFDHKQKEDFLRKWFMLEQKVKATQQGRTLNLEKAGVRARQQAAAVLEYLADNRSLSDLSGIPMLLHLIALVWQQQHSRPKSRTKLFEVALNYLLEYRDEQRKIYPPLSAEQSHRVLQPVALWMQEELASDEAPQREMQTKMALNLEKTASELSPADFCDFLVKRAGILARQGKKNFIFRHKSIREYFAGLQLVEEYAAGGRIQRLVDTFYQEWWKEPLRFFLSRAEETAFISFFERFFASERSHDLDAKEQDYLETLVREATHRTWDPFITCLQSSDATGEQQRYALSCLKIIGGKTVLAFLRDYVAAGRGQHLQYAREIVAAAEPAPARVATAESTTLFRRLPASFRNSFEYHAEYLLLPAGEIVYSVDGEIKQIPNLYLAKYPVTNKQYRRFIRYLQRDDPELRERYPLDGFVENLLEFSGKDGGFQKYLGEEWKQWPATLKSEEDENRKFNSDDQPVVGVSWYGARAYCFWLSYLELVSSEQPVNAATLAGCYRLPHEWEWERAAAGTKAEGGPREYPWPAERGGPSDKLANYENNVGHTTPVGRYPDGATPQGLQDMAGNVLEWQENWYDNQRSRRSLRGGAWCSGPGLLRCSVRSWYVPRYRNDTIGFRVLRPESQL